MNKTIRRAAAVCMALLLLGLGGCGSVRFAPEESSLYLSKDGTVTGAEIESFDNSAFEEPRYEEEGLTAFVEDAVISYNKENGGAQFAYADDTEEALPVSIGKLTVEDSVAALYLNYASCEDYLAFNGTDETVTQLACMTAPEAVAAGISLENLVDRSGDPVDPQKIQENEKYRVAVAAGEFSLVVDGTIDAVSQGVTVEDRHTVRVSGTEEVCVVFK